MTAQRDQEGFGLLLMLVISLAIFALLAAGVYFGYGRQKSTVQIGQEAIGEAEALQKQAQEQAQQAQDALRNIGQ